MCVLRISSFVINWSFGSYGWFICCGCFICWSWGRWCFLIWSFDSCFLLKWCCYYSRKFFFFLCLCPGFFSGVNFTNTSCLVCLGFGMFCLRHGVYIFYGLRDVGGILTFHSFWWLSVVCDNPLSVILTFFAWWFYLSRDLVPCYFGGLVVGALDIFWLDWTLCSFEVLPSRWCHLLTDLDG